MYSFSDLSPSMATALSSPIMVCWGYSSFKDKTKCARQPKVHIKTRSVRYNQHCMPLPGVELICFNLVDKIKSGVPTTVFTAYIF